jgi:hypothetical protein
MNKMVPGFNQKTRDSENKLPGRDERAKYRSCERAKVRGGEGKAVMLPDYRHKVLLFFGDFVSVFVVRLITDHTNIGSNRNRFTFKGAVPSL